MSPGKCQHILRDKCQCNHHSMIYMFLDKNLYIHIDIPTVICFHLL